MIRVSIFLVGIEVLGGVPGLTQIIRAQSDAAQPAKTGRHEFEVASIKPSNSTDHRPRVDLFHLGSGGEFTAANMTVRSLIRLAYNIKDFQISGGPGWVDSDLFDIAAKPEGPTNSDQFQLMLQSLLADRFKLVVHRETKELPGYNLVIAKNGPKFKDAHESDPNIPQLNGRTDLPSSGPRMRVSIIRRGLLVTQGTTMSGLAVSLSSILGRTVVDKTDLAGMYDLKLEWMPDENEVAMFQSMGVPEGLGAPAADPLGPSIFTAVQEQLGLRLESGKGPVEMFVIDRVEQPGEN